MLSRMFLAKLGWRRFSITVISDMQSMKDVDWVFLAEGRDKGGQLCTR
jgi:hypothetical protein